MKKIKKTLILILMIIFLSGTLIIGQKIGNSDRDDNNLYFGYYNGNEKLDEMPSKEDDFIFSRGECDNGAYIEWNESEWSPLVKNLSKSKTKCRLYFRKKESIEMCNKYGSESALCYITKLGEEDKINLAYDGKEVLGEELGTKDNNLRYIGGDPNNYISFNNEIWRIIGIIKVKIENGDIVERIKIIRVNGIQGQNDFGNFIWSNENVNNWATSNLKDMLNGIYYNSESGNCYITSMEETSTCDFTESSGNVKGLLSVQHLIDSDIVWSLGGKESYIAISKAFYEAERGSETCGNVRPTELTKDNDPDYHNGVGLMYPSDYGYAVGEKNRILCLNKILHDDNLNDYRSNDCAANDWLKPPNDFYWTLTASIGHGVFHINSKGYVDGGGAGNSFRGIAPVVYLKSDVKIVLDNNKNYGSIDNPFRIKSE